MSWKATAYVKSLTENITPAEKLLLFVLSDYYNDHQQVAWPSVAMLAQESLMSERQARRLLSDLAEKGFIGRKQSSGRNTNLYTFPALQPGQNVMVEKANPDINPDKNGPQPGHSYVSQTVEQEINSKTFVLSGESTPEAPTPKKPPKSKNVDPRHATFRQKLEKYYKYLNPDMGEYYWTPVDAKNLKLFLDRWPSLTIGKFHEWLDNRWNSDGVVFSETPYQFLSRLNKYADGPLNAFGKPVEDSRESV